MEGNLLSIKDVASFLSVTTRTVMNLISRKELKGLKVGNRWRFTREDVQAYLHQRRQEEAST